MTQSSAQKFEVSRAAIRHEYKDPLKLLDTFSAVPSFADGFLSGIEVSEFRKDCPLPKFGVKSGDVIQMVNGQSIQTPKDIMDIGKKITNLNSGSAVRVLIRREGKTLTNSYKILD